MFSFISLILTLGLVPVIVRRSSLFHCDNILSELQNNGPQHLVLLRRGLGAEVRPGRANLVEHNHFADFAPAGWIRPHQRHRQD